MLVTNTELNDGITIFDQLNFSGSDGGDGDDGGGDGDDGGGGDGDDGGGDETDTQPDTSPDHSEESDADSPDVSHTAEPPSVPEGEPNDS